jgi:hypothetical protein
MRINFDDLKAKGFQVSQMADDTYEVFLSKPISYELLQLLHEGIQSPGLKDIVTAAVAEAREQALFLEAVRG